MAQESDIEPHLSVKLALGKAAAKLEDSRNWSNVGAEKLNRDEYDRRWRSNDHPSFDVFYRESDGIFLIESEDPEVSVEGTDIDELSFEFIQKFKELEASRKKTSRKGGSQQT